MTGHEHVHPNVGGIYESSAVRVAFSDLPEDALTQAVQWSQARDVDWNQVLHGDGFASAYPMFYGEISPKACAADSVFCRHGIVPRRSQLPSHS